MNNDEQDDEKKEQARVKDSGSAELNFKTLLERFYLRYAPQKPEDRQTTLPAERRKAGDC
jgi:hypothetical protein